MAVTSTTTRISMRDMTPGDLRAVRRIESAAYEDAWPARVFDQELQNQFAHYRVAIERAGSDEGDGGVWRALRRRFGGHVDGRIVGFMGAWYMVDQLHLVTIAVDPRDQGRGIGQRLLLDCFDLAFAAELPAIVLEVRESNDRARQLYRSFGFRDTGRLRAYYQDNDEDAIVMLAEGLDTDTGRETHESRRRAHVERYGELFDSTSGDARET